MTPRGVIDVGSMVGNITGNHKIYIMKRGITKAAVNHAKEILRLHAEQNPDESLNVQPAVSEGGITALVKDKYRTYINSIVQDSLIADILQSLNVQGEEPPKGKAWISVEDKLPKIECLAANFAKGTYGYKEYIIGYVSADGLFYKCETNHELLKNVTHWMPLPPTPEGKGGEG